MLIQRIIKNTSQHGQALLFVVLAMTIALTVGIAVSSRTLSGLRRTSSTDSASRVFAAAEGGIEWFLIQPLSVLENLSDGETQSGNECPQGTTWDSTKPQGCKVSYIPQSSDNIQSDAWVTVSKFSFNYDVPGQENYWFKLDAGTLKEVTLKDYITQTFYRGDLDICWTSQDSSQSSLIYYSTYNLNGVREKKLVSPLNNKGVTDTEGAVPATNNRTDLGYDDCYKVSINEDTEGIRIKTLYAASKVAVFATGNNFPTQGYKITSLGELNNVAEKAKATKEIVAYKSLPYVPGAFDYSIYSTLPIN